MFNLEPLVSSSDIRQVQLVHLRPEI